MVNSAHPSVERVRKALRAHGLDPEVRWFDDAATTAVAAANALGVDIGAIANSLVFTLDGEPLLVLTSGAHRVDAVWLGDRLGGTIGRASKDVVKQATGQVIGGVAPLGHPSPLRTLVDVALAEFPVVWAAAGHAHTVFPTTFDELVRITGGESTAVAP
ncbi:MULTISPECIES: YbaK/EbsC family protein [Cryobacterium]|uniref:YbaK/EbsC family protein n=1 Tax=Cryobacterium breve TaxID=1259258 RepID=A0ABY2J729_9MICO|nr:MULTISPECIES: YbaK/EbsC family protein [Cryobacterium]TFC96245.1 YbaK/EbsC family protein [Cryobacterium sp. TmT3-12]TFD00750.1 YbaK/EbsC family protein [Cryobacterium breve]